MKARNFALARILTAHAEEFEQYLREERVKLGLPAEKSSKKQTNQEKIAKLQERIAKLQEEIDMELEDMGPLE